MRALDTRDYFDEWEVGEIALELDDREPQEVLRWGTAIFEESAVPEEWSAYVEINDLWFEDRVAARALIGELESVGAG